MSSQPSLPDDPRLAEVARQLARTRGASILCDAGWRLVWVSEDLKELLGEHDEAKIGYGKHLIEAYMSATWASKVTPTSQMSTFLAAFPFVMHDTPGGKEALRHIFRNAVDNWVDPPDWVAAALDARDEIAAFLFGDLEPLVPPPTWTHEFDFVPGPDVPPQRIIEISVRLYDESGRFIGTAGLYDPGLPARVLSLVARGDEGMFERMANLVHPGRRRAAILFADLELSSALSRRLPSAAYFDLIREVTTAMDEVVIEHRGIVGKHAGDGVTAFFIADDIGTSSATAGAAIEAARGITVATANAAKRVGERSGLVEASGCLVNVGIHWGGTLYMGQLVTGGRLEVTALGDEVNECARIQQSARGGEVLASKALVEHLEEGDAAALGLDPDAVIYRTIAELPGAPEKAVRDVGNLPVTTL